MPLRMSRRRPPNQVKHPNPTSTEYRALTPAEFLALTRRGAGADEGHRTYRAFLDGVSETFLTLHTRDGRHHCPAYAQLSFVGGDERGGTEIRLVFTKMAVVIAGRQLLPVFASVRSKKAAHLYEFDGERYDPPVPGQPVITELTFELAPTRS